MKRIRNFRPPYVICHTERQLVNEPRTLEEPSQEYHVSRERVRQIEVRAFEKLQKSMQSIAGERRLMLPAA